MFRCQTMDLSSIQSSSTYFDFGGFYCKYWSLAPACASVTSHPFTDDENDLEEDVHFNIRSCASLARIVRFAATSFLRIQFVNRSSICVIVLHLMYVDIVIHAGCLRKKFQLVRFFFKKLIEMQILG